MPFSVLLKSDQQSVGAVANSSTPPTAHAPRVEDEIRNKVQFNSIELNSNEIQSRACVAGVGAIFSDLPPFSDHPAYMRNTTLSTYRLRRGYKGANFKNEFQN